jgi:hypothetical protein
VSHIPGDPPESSHGFELNAPAAYTPGVQSTDGFTLAGSVANSGLYIPPPPLPEGRRRNQFGEGPFARLVMPPLPTEPGLCLWQQDEHIVYVGQTRTPLRKRLNEARYPVEESRGNATKYSQRNS